ncbi:hypothetical protein DFP72DRAFT_754420, partial [Ephemerocybe angulata]
RVRHLTRQCQRPPRTLDGNFNIEHLINYLKALFSAQGVYGHWECCRNLSASVNNLMLLKWQMTKSLNLSYQGSRHSTNEGNRKEVVLRMAQKAKELKLHEQIPGREAVLRPDLRALGLQCTEQSGLANFNKKI